MISEEQLKDECENAILKALAILRKVGREEDLTEIEVALATVLDNWEDDIQADKEFKKELEEEKKLKTKI